MSPTNCNRQRVNDNRNAQLVTGNHNCNKNRKRSITFDDKLYVQTVAVSEGFNLRVKN